MPPPTTEELWPWAESCPLLRAPEYNCAEIVITVHLGRVVGVDVKQKHRRPRARPPNRGTGRSKQSKPAT